MPPRSVNNAFGDSSPSWNLEFPVGNLTAAEIVAYLPHWLKSIDVINRFVCNGGGAMAIVDMVNGFRDLPGGLSMHRNSVCIMMQNAMRNAGYKGWTVGTHFDWVQERLGEWNTDDICVTGYRTPRLTHPKSGNATACNLPANPIQFRDLASHVVEHPTGPDALDLTRCIAYARSHPDQSWLFPNQFEQLVNHLGGPRDVTIANSDSAVFTRYSSNQVTPLTERTHRLRAAPVSAARSGNKKTNDNKTNDKKTSDKKTDGRVNKARKRPSQSRQPLAALSATRVEGLPQVGVAISLPAMPLTRSHTTATGNAAPSPHQRTPRIPSGATIDVGGIRKSSRLAKKPSQTLRESPALSEDAEEGNPYKNNNGAQWSTGRKRKRVEDDYVPTPNDKIFSSSDSDHGVVDDDFSPTPTPHSRNHPEPASRRAAKKARIAIHDVITSQHASLYRMPVKAAVPIDPAIADAIRQFENRVPTFVKPPVLNPDRLQVDHNSIWLYAEEGASDMWASALSSTRFGGPRRYAPFRELFRLTDPDFEDASDWAENIRWAKQQFKLFSSDTWTEYDYHLEMITEHRRKDHWVSEEAILHGKF